LFKISTAQNYEKMQFVIVTYQHLLTKLLTTC